MDFGYLAKRYGKVAVSVALVGLTVASSALNSHGTLTASDWQHVALACLGALGVYFAPYVPAKPAE